MIRHLRDFVHRCWKKACVIQQNVWSSQVGGKNVFLGGASQGPLEGWVDFPVGFSDGLGLAGCGTALHAALTYEGELGGVIGYLAKMRLIVTRLSLVVLEISHGKKKKNQNRGIRRIHSWPHPARLRHHGSFVDLYPDQCQVGCQEDSNLRVTSNKQLASAISIRVVTWNLIDTGSWSIEICTYV